MSRLLEKRNTIYGLCAVWIVVFHVFRRIGMPYIPVLTDLVRLGNLSVDIFFFFSGLCLTLSVRRHRYTQVGWKEYYKKRFIRILIPYLLIGGAYYLWSAVCKTSGGFVRRAAMFLFNLSSASFWLRGTQTTWYVYGILVFYLIFPALYLFLANGRRVRTAGLLIGAILFAILSAYLPVLNNSTIVWARLPVFLIGILAGLHSDKIRLDGKHAVLTVLSTVFFVLAGWLISISERTDAFTLPSVYRFLLYIPMTMAFLILFSDYGPKSRLFGWIGGLSLEIYLVHVTGLHPLKEYGLMEAAGYWLYLILPVISVLLSALAGRLEKLITKRIIS